MSRISNKEEFILKAKLIHGDKYDYSLSEYTHSHHKIKIICPNHGVFEKTTGNHINNKQGCFECLKNINNEKFISKSTVIHNGKYDYSKVEYIDNRTKVKIICTKHGEFEQTPNNHLSGSKCRTCKYENISINSRKSSVIFIQDSIKKHGSKYDYSLVNYINNKTKVKIICKVHGIFEQKPDAHLFGQGCIKCSGKEKINREEFIKRSINKHGNKYDYSLVEYVDKKVKIICRLHGTFEQNPKGHLKGIGCWKCKKNYPLTHDDFLKKSKEIHFDKYDYSKSEYKSSLSKLIIICKNHGEFKQTPNKHITLKQGCPRCNDSKGENYINDYLKYNNIKFIREKRFNGCKNKFSLPFDFYLPIFNICIEYDGIQHFEPIEIWGGHKSLIKTIMRDNIKNEYCKKNNIKLIRISYKENIEERMREIISSHLY